MEDRDVARDSQGCGLVGLTNEKLLELTELTENFELSVTFSEEGTDSQGEASWSGSLEEEPFKLTVSGPASAMVGLPYTGRDIARPVSHCSSS